MSNDQPAREKPIDELRQVTGRQWPAIARAATQTQERLEELSKLVADATTDDVAVVVFGSLARAEATTGSDVDWTLLIDGGADPAHFETMLSVEGRMLDADLVAPGKEGTFGGLAFSHEIVHNIGGGEDTNRNTTQRILLLLESVPVGNPNAYKRVVNSVLTRYILEDWGWVHDRGPKRVPRFLQNDFARYWRTVAVDFAYKRRARSAAGWALRTVKLRMSRKAAYAAGLLACFSCDLEEVSSGKAPTGENLPQAVVSHLANRFAFTPLEIIAKLALQSPTLQATAVELLAAYDRFLALIDDEARRKHLSELVPAKAKNDEVYEEARTISHSFQLGLDRLFFREDPRIRELTEIYGVF